MLFLLFSVYFRCFETKTKTLILITRQQRQSNTLKSFQMSLSEIAVFLDTVDGSFFDKTNQISKHFRRIQMKTSRSSIKTKIFDYSRKFFRQSFGNLQKQIVTRKYLLHCNWYTRCYHINITSAGPRISRLRYFPRLRAKYLIIYTN